MKIVNLENKQRKEQLMYSRCASQPCVDLRITLCRFASFGETGVECCDVFLNPNWSNFGCSFFGQTILLFSDFPVNTSREKKELSVAMPSHRPFGFLNRSLVHEITSSSHQFHTYNAQAPT